MSSIVGDHNNTSETSDSDSDYEPEPESIAYKLKNMKSDFSTEIKKGCKIKGCDGSGNTKNADNMIKYKKHYKEKFCPLK